MTDDQKSDRGLMLEQALLVHRRGREMTKPHAVLAKQLHERGRTCDVQEFLDKYRAARLIKAADYKRMKNALVLGKPEVLVELAPRMW